MSVPTVSQAPPLSPIVGRGTFQALPPLTTGVPEQVSSFSPLSSLSPQRKVLRQHAEHRPSFGYSDSFPGLGLSFVALSPALPLLPPPLSPSPSWVDCMLPSLLGRSLSSLVLACLSLPEAASLSVTEPVTGPSSLCVAQTPCSPLWVRHLTLSPAMHDPVSLSRLLTHPYPCCALGIQRGTGRAPVP